MPSTFKRPPRVAVVGTGMYYRKLRPGLTRYFELGALIDRNATPPLPEQVAEVVRASRHDAVMLLTPNAEHAGQVVALARLRLPVFAEKPLATTRESLSEVEDSLPANPLLYCSDFYPDVRAAPLLSWIGNSPPWLRPDDLQVTGDRALFCAGPCLISGLTRATAVLREGSGDAASFDGRPWLWDPVHGGVLWDLAYHYLTLWRVAFRSPLTLTRADLGVIETAPPGPVAETRAKLELRSGTGLQFLMEVGKYYRQGNERWVRLEGGDDWSATMTFGRQNRLVISSADATCEVTLTGDYYARVSQAFRYYLDTEPAHPFGLSAAKAAIDVIVQAKMSLPPRRLRPY